jgi:hypothetical protein
MKPAPGSGSEAKRRAANARISASSGGVMCMWFLSVVPGGGI